MALHHETITKPVGYSVGDIKLITYNVTFTSHQLVEAERGWFLLDGAVVSQTTYPTLFAHYGSTFNTGGEGAGNFRLPDMTDGKVPIPKGLTNFTAFGASGGEINHTVSLAEFSAHIHPDTFSITAAAHGAAGANPHAVTTDTVGSTNASHFDHTYTENVMSGAIGSSGSLPNDKATSLIATTSGLATHTHTPTLTVASATNTTISAGTGLLTGSIISTGAGGSHNNLQPYLVMGGWLVRYG